MIRPLLRFCLRCVAAAMTAASVLIAAGVWWLASGPISLGPVEPYLAEALAQSGSPYRIAFRDAVLEWAGWERRIDLRLRHVAALTEEGAALVEVPEVAVSLSVPALLRGMLAPTSFELLRPRLRLLRAPDGAVALDVGEGGAIAGESLPLLADLLEPPSRRRAMGYLSRLAVTDAAVTLIDRASGTEWRAVDADLAIVRDAEGIVATGEVPLVVGEHRVALELAARYGLAERRLVGDVHFTGAVPAWFAEAGAALAPLDAIAVPLSGRLGVAFDPAGALERIDFAVELGPGALDPSPWFPDEFEDVPFEVVSGRLVGELLPAIERLRLTEARLDVGGPTLVATATLNGFGPRPAITVAAEVAGLPVDELRRYWPRSVSGKTRDWVLAYIRDGRIERATARLDLRPEDYESERLRPEAVATELRVVGATVDYYAPLPPVRGASGTITITGRDFEARLESGRVHDLRIEAGTVAIRDMGHADDTEIALRLSGPLADALAIVDHPELGFVKAVGLDAGGVSGRVRGELGLRFPLLEGSGFSNVSVRVTARLEDVVAADFLDGYDVSGGAFDLQLDNAGLVMSGSASLVGIPASLTWRESFAADAPVRRRYSVSAELGDSARRALGLPGGAWITGPIPVDLDIAIAADGGRSWHAVAVLDAAWLRLPALRWQKPAGVPGLFSLAARARPGGPAVIDTVSVSAGDLFLDARARLAEDGGLADAEVARLAIGGNELTGALAREEGRFRLRLRGERLDLRPFLAGDDGGEEDDGLSLPDAIAEIAVAQVIAADDRLFRDVRGTLETAAGKVQRGALSGRIGEAALALALTPGSGGRVLRVDAEDAGNLLRAFEIYRDMEGGRLSFRIALDAPERPGILVVEEFRIRRAPALAKLLAVASLDGFFDLLRGEGLPFTRLVVPFAYGERVIRIREARAFGPALGLTAEGVIGREPRSLELRGTLVPAYTINNVLGRLPLVGKLLVPEKGGGVFAIAFAAVGPFEDPTITVNPLTALAPGVLQNLFSAVPEAADGGVPAATGR